MFDKCVIDWRTKKQALTGGSSCEAEYMALYEAVTNALWFTWVSNGIKINIKNGILIYEDNQGCIDVANDVCPHRKRKAIDIKYHRIQDEVKRNYVRISHIPTANQISDILTKPLSNVKFLYFREKLGLVSNNIKLLILRNKKNNKIY